uniref:Uncharacterized protein n=1 Tax=Arundo donax TaxID=35708 RepID=A0A0A9H941_ARUDO
MLTIQQTKPLVQELTFTKVLLQRHGYVGTFCRRLDLDNNQNEDNEVKIGKLMSIWKPRDLLEAIKSLLSRRLRFIDFDIEIF